MSLSQVKVERLLYPAHAMYGSGEIANHTVDDKQKRMDSNGRPEVAYVDASRGDLLYTKAADFNKLNDLEKSRAHFVFDDSSIKRYEKLDAVQDYKPVKARQEETSSEAESSDNKDKN